MVWAIDARRLRQGLVVAVSIAGAVLLARAFGIVDRPYRAGLAVLRAVPPPSRRHVEPVYRGSSDRPWAALAVNVDWGEEVLPAMLEKLQRHGVKATFFLTGRWAQQFPDLARRIAEEGHEIGNHGVDHYHPAELTNEELDWLVRENARLLERLTGKRTVLFAPPYGEVDGRIARVAAGAGHYTVMWSVDTIDWQRPPSDQILERVARRAGPGAIILMHPTEPTVEALPDVIDLLRRRNLTLVPVGRLVAALHEAELASPDSGLTGNGQ